jgi:hypothetical protein
LAYDNEAITHLRERYEGLKSSTERTNCEGHWQEVAELVSPRKIDFVGMRTPGEKRMTKVYDSTGIHANEMLAAGLHGMATNPASKWFSLRMVAGNTTDANGERTSINEVPAVQQYLADAEDVMWSKIYQPGTNFTTTLHEAYLDLGSFGTAVIYVGQRDDNGLLFESRPLAECVICENADGRVDTLFRCTSYTVRQMMQLERKGTWKKISEETRKKYDDKLYDDKVEVIHAVFPREEQEYGKKDRLNMPFASVYFEREACHFLEESGFPEFPYLVPRWSKYAAEVYGRSPAMTALPDIKMLQATELTLIKLLQKAADPPIGIRDDSIIGAARTVPGGLMYFRGDPREAMMPMPVSIQGIQAVVQKQTELRERILRTFFADIMRMTDRANMTATEVMQRTSEQMRLFGPLIGRLESELLGPMVDRIFGILSRLGQLPPAPQEIQEQEFTVEYVSPIATAQKQQAVNGIVQTFQLLGMFGPEVAAQIVQKRIDVDKMVTWLWDLFNNDPDLLRNEEALAQAAQMEQAQQQLAIAGPAASVMATGARGVKDLSGAAEKGGNLMQLVSQFSKHAAENPRAQQEMRALAKGEMPEEMPI